MLRALHRHLRYYTVLYQSNIIARQVTSTKNHAYCTCNLQIII